MRPSFAPAVLLVLTACASEEIRRETRKNRAAEAEYGRSLQVGMTKEEVKALGHEPGNCIGNPQTVERCETRFFTDMSDAWPLPSSYSNQKYEIYDMTFEKGRLTLWGKRADHRLQDDLSGRPNPPIPR